MANIKLSFLFLLQILVNYGIHAQDWDTIINDLKSHSSLRGVYSFDHEFIKCLEDDPDFYLMNPNTSSFLKRESSLAKGNLYYFAVNEPSKDYIQVIVAAASNYYPSLVLLNFNHYGNLISELVLDQLWVDAGQAYDCQAEIYNDKIIHDFMDYDIGFEPFFKLDRTVFKLHKTGRLDTVKKTSEMKIIPDSQFELLRNIIDIKDQGFKYTFAIVDNAKKDTFEISKSLRKDYPKPVCFLFDSNEKVVVEESDYGIESVIKVIDLKKRQTLFEVKGGLFTGKGYGKHIDSLHDVLLYFYSDKQGKDTSLSLLALNYQCGEIKWILDFDKIPYVDMPSIDVDHRSRTV